MLQESALAEETAALKLESCFLTLFDPQAVQAGTGAEELRTSFSKPVPHFSH